MRLCHRVSVESGGVHPGRVGHPGWMWLKGTGMGIRPWSTTREDRGAAAVEFALVSTVLLSLVIGMIQYSWYFYAMQRGTSAVSDLTRRLSVGDCRVAADATSFLTARLGEATTATTVSPTITYYGASDPGATTTTPEVGGYVTASVSFPTFNLNIFPLPDGGNVSRSVTAKVEDNEATSGGCS